MTSESSVRGVPEAEPGAAAPETGAEADTELGPAADEDATTCCDGLSDDCNAGPGRESALVAPISCRLRRVSAATSSSSTRTGIASPSAAKADAVADVPACWSGACEAPGWARVGWRGLLSSSDRGVVSNAVASGLAAGRGSALVRPIVGSE